MIHRLLTIPHFLYLAVFSFYLPLSECRKPKGGQESITKIRVGTTGGRGGNYEKLEIDADSTVYLQALRGNEHYIREKTAPAFWKDLTGRVRLADLDRVRSNPGHALYDGIDKTLEVETIKGKHTLVNGEEDTANYRRLQPLTGLLDRKLDSLRKAMALPGER